MFRQMTDSVMWACVVIIQQTCKYWKYTQMRNSTYGWALSEGETNPMLFSKSRLRIVIGQSGNSLSFLALHFSHWNQMYHLSWTSWCHAIFNISQTFSCVCLCNSKMLKSARRNTCFAAFLFQIPISPLWVSAGCSCTTATSGGSGGQKEDTHSLLCPLFCKFNLTAALYSTLSKLCFKWDFVQREDHLTYYLCYFQVHTAGCWWACWEPLIEKELPGGHCDFIRA